MIKCKQCLSEPPECGKDICCKVCDERKTCEGSCTSYQDYEDEICPDEYDDAEIVPIEKKYAEVFRTVSDIAIRKKELEDQEKKVRESLTQAMEEYGIKSFDNEFIKVTYVAATQQISVDTTRLKKEHPEIAEAYKKVTNKKAYVKVEVK